MLLSLSLSLSLSVSGPRKTKGKKKREGEGVSLVDTHARGRFAKWSNDACWQLIHIVCMNDFSI